MASGDRIRKKKKDELPNTNGEGHLSLNALQDLDADDYVVLRNIAHNPDGGIIFLFRIDSPNNQQISRMFKRDGGYIGMPFSLRRMNKLVKRNLITRTDKHLSYADYKYEINYKINPKVYAIIKTIEAL